MTIGRRSLGDGYFYFISNLGIEIIGTNTHGSKSACESYLRVRGMPVVFNPD